MAGNWKQWEGQTVAGKFHLRQYLGGSDHSAVYLTDSGELPRAAIKFTPASPETASLLLSRLAQAEKLSHPNLIRLLQSGQCRVAGQDLCYVVMEYAEEDLSQILPQRALSPAETQQMLSPVLDALTHIHHAGLVHAHLQPSNIMAIADQVKLSSDGIRRAGEANANVVTGGVYAAPELAAGGTASAASDVWSLGATLVQVLTQRPPEFGQGSSEPLLPALPAPFLEIVRHCLVRDPQRRWGIAEIAATLPQSSASPRQTASGIRQPSKNRYLFPLAGAGLLLAIVVGAWLLNRPAHVSSAPSPAVQPANAPSPQVPNASAMGRGAVGTAAAKPSASGNTPGAVVEQPLPNVPQSARNTIQGRIKVRLKLDVDPSGKVVATRFISAGPSKYFARLAQEAAQKWKFTPPQINGQEVASQWILRFEFSRTSTNVQPSQVTP